MLENEQDRKKVIGRETTREVLERLKAQEDKPRPKLESFYTEIKEETDSVKNIPEQNIENLMRKIEALERRMKQGNNYLSFYHDLKKLNDKFLKEALFIERNNIQISKNAMDKILKKKKEIEVGKK